MILLRFDVGCGSKPSGDVNVAFFEAAGIFRRRNF
jgi:hypothetical protein